VANLILTTVSVPRVLRFEVSQLLIESERRFYLPLPKLNRLQVDFLKRELLDEGYSVSSSESLVARKGSLSLYVSPAGLASSSSDLMDVLLPSIPNILAFPKTPLETNPYVAVKRGRGLFEVHLFPRLESMGRWTALRRQGDCGLTPDEALVLERLLGGSEELIGCIADYPTEGCTTTHAGRHPLYRCMVPADEFVCNLRTISRTSARNTYLPRSSILTMKKSPAQIGPEDSRQLGEWCYLSFPKTSNP
jgi:hypothetical protein